MNAAIYVRVSSDEQARRGFSIASQEEMCARRAAEIGATTVTRFADEGISGSVLERPGLRALRDRVKAGSIDAVVVFDPDRLSRNLAHQLLVTEEFERSGVRLEFVNFQWQDTPEGRLFYALKGAISQYEKAKIRERTALGRKQRARSGRLPSGFEPYGYVYDRESGTLRVNAYEADWVRRMFSWILEGKGPNRIAAMLNEMGVSRKRGGLKWHRSVVLRILSNEVYCGTFYANRYDCEDVSIGRYLPAGQKARVTLRPRAEWIPIEVPEIVPEGVFREAQGLLSRARRLWPGGAHEKYLLSGLVVCGGCGRPMAGRSSVDWGVRRRSYSCRSRGGCGLAAPAAELEREVWSLVRSAVGGPVTLAASAPVRTEIEDLSRRLEEAGHELNRIESARAGLVQCIVRGLVGTAEGQRRLDDLGRELAGVTAEVERMRGTIAELSRADLLWMTRAAETWLPRLDEMDESRRRDLVRSLVTAIVVRRPEGSRGEVSVEVTGYLEEPSGVDCTREGDPDVPAIDPQDQG